MKLSVGWYVGRLVCRPSVVRSISCDHPFIWSIPNLVQGLSSMSKWSLLIFRSHVQRSRSNHSFEPSVLSTLYILIHCLLVLDRFCFYREDKPEFCTMGGIYVSETFLVSICNKYIKWREWLSTCTTPLNILEEVVNLCMYWKIGRRRPCH